ncbi:MAG: EAL domain-containing protein [Pleomorphochaeta sp.]
MNHMYFHYNFDITAIVLLITIKLLLVTQRQISNPTQRPFLWYVGLSILASSLNIFSIYSLNSDSYTVNIAYFICDLFYLTFLLQVLSVYLYFNKRFDMKRNYRAFYLSIPAITSLLLLLSNRSTNVLFSISETKEFTYGPLYFILWISACLYLIDSFYFLFKENKTLQKRKLHLLVFCGIFFVATTIIHYFIPETQLLQFANSILILIMFIERQSPLLLEDMETGVLNADTFNNFILNQTTNETILLFVHIKNASLSNEAASFSFIPSVYSTIINKIKKQIKRTIIFRLDKNTFALVLKKEKDKIITSNIWIKEFDNLKDSSMAALPIRLLFANTAPMKEFSDRTSLKNAIQWGIMKLQDSSTKLDEYITPDYAIKYTRNRIIDTEIHKIVNHKPIEFNLQPIYNLESESFDTAEALARIKIPSIGFVPCSEFIDMSESNGTIIALGKSILEEICNVINTIQLPIDNISINVSMAHFMENSIVEDFMHIINKNNIPTSKIILEVTESIQPINTRLLNENMIKLKEAGFKLSLDDFGTGYSTLESLLTLPYDIIKLDRNLLLACEKETIKIDILKKVVKMIKSLNFEVVLEGVETKRQDQIAREIGVDKIQGYYYSKPLDLPGIISFFNK